MFQHKKILLGVTGSIAAYKAALLIRLLVKEGAEVKVIMTTSACDFITPLTLSVLSKNPVSIEMFNRETGEWNNHVHLARWADMFIIAPASANSIARFTTGECDNMLTAVYLSAVCKKYIAPAMDAEMWEHATVKKNISTLKSHGCVIIPPAKGELASGISGEGRMEEPENILRIIKDDFFLTLPLHGKKALVTAGPTRENIDAVRYISNRSSGKMGFAIAEALASLGAEVTLISGPTSLAASAAVKEIRIESAAEMQNACMKIFPESDIVVMAAAVADFMPEKSFHNKVKKTKANAELKLKPTSDILAEMGKKKKKNQLLIGFALETDNEIANAVKKLKEKNLDVIVLNSLNDKGAGFEKDTNKVTVVHKSGKKTAYPLKQKTDAARDIAGEIINLLKKK
jgi:phosphopantothenoylcysteine decarboxylase / phosphopantothenate---cysteine ligase